MGSIGGLVETSAGRSTSDLRLDDATASELDKVARLLDEVYAVFRGHLPPEVWENYIGEIVGVRGRLGDSELIVAERAGRLVGTIGFYPDASRSAVERWPERWASIRTLAVRADARRQGLGEALVRECVRRARERKARRSAYTPPRTCPRQRAYTSGSAFAARPSSTSRSARCSPAGRCRRRQSWQAQAYRLDLEEV
jgi:GNAT superfamily N-acetyltransferase